MNQLEPEIKTDVTIIGAGVLGVCLAYHLRSQGLECVVLEREPFAGVHASGKNAGMLRQLYRHPQLSNWARRTISDMPSQIKQLCFRQTGSLIVGRNVPSHHPELFTETTMKSRSSGEEVEAVYTPGDGLLDSPSYVMEMCKLSKMAGAKYLFRETVIDVERSDSVWRTRTKSNKSVCSKWVVNAAGAWVNSFLDCHDNLQVHAQAFARHLMLIEGWPIGYMPNEKSGFHWDERSNWYMRLWDKNSRLVSICDQVPCVPEQFSASNSILEQTSETLITELPHLADHLRIGTHWHCFRTYCKDRLPIWGEDQEHKGFFWLAGFGGLGMSTSYAATEDAAQYISGKSSFAFEDFSPRRVKKFGALPKRASALT